ncbi:MAG: tyrosine-type recombinase/integrase, partial [Planctomycetota bacterium]
MKWEYWICLYTGTHCTARGLRPLTIVAYRTTLLQFQAYMEVRQSKVSPDEVTSCHVLEYVEFLRRERDNGDSAVNRQVTILKNFYRAMVALGHLEPSANPLAYFPRMKKTPRKLPVSLSFEEIDGLLRRPPDDTVLGLRDRAILTLLYGTGIRASECAGLKEEDMDLKEGTVRVTGKGGHQRVIPLNGQVIEVVEAYRQVRGETSPGSTFFQTRSRRPMSRNAIFERVRMHARGAGIRKIVSPHRLRHTFATHLVKTGAKIVTIRDLLGHRQITSTQIYIHVTAHDLREAVNA